MDPLLYKFAVVTRKEDADIICPLQKIAGDCPWFDAIASIRFLVMFYPIHVWGLRGTKGTILCVDGREGFIMTLVPLNDKCK